MLKVLRSAATATAPPRSSSLGMACVKNFIDWRITQNAVCVETVGAKILLNFFFGIYVYDAPQTHAIN